MTTYWGTLLRRRGRGSRGIYHNEDGRRCIHRRQHTSTGLTGKSWEREKLEQEQEIDIYALLFFTIIILDRLNWMIKWWQLLCPKHWTALLMSTNTHTHTHINQRKCWYRFHRCSQTINVINKWKNGILKYCYKRMKCKIKTIINVFV